MAETCELTQSPVDAALDQLLSFAEYGDHAIARMQGIAIAPSREDPTRLVISDANQNMRIEIPMDPTLPGPFEIQYIDVLAGQEHKLLYMCRKVEGIRYFENISAETRWLNRPERLPVEYRTIAPHIAYMLHHHIISPMNAVAA